MTLTTTPSVEARANGANAVVGIDIDHTIIPDSMMMVSVSGTAVRLD